MSQEDQTVDLLSPKTSAQSLIDENEELSARLMASVRRNGDLERRLQEADFSRGEHERRIETLSEQILVYREKDRLQKDRLEKTEGRLKKLLSELELHELRYAELFSTSQSNLRKFEETKTTLLRKIKHLYRFNCWARERLFPAYRRQREENSGLRGALDEAQRQFLHAHNALQALKEAENLQSELLKQETAVLHQEISQLSERYRDLEQKNTSLKDERAIQQNRVIAAERMRDEIQDKLKKETAEWQARWAEFQEEARRFKVENQELREQVLHLENEQKKLVRQNEKLRDQNESLQELWGDNRRQLEKLTARETALQKLNQELSQQLKETRLAGSEIKKELIEARKGAEQNLNRLKTELALMDKSRDPDVSAKAPVPKETMDRIEGLLAEIQSGYSRPVISGRLANHDFIERDELLSEEGLLRL